MTARDVTVRDLLDALTELTRRCDGDEGVRADGSNIDTATAHAVLDGRCEACEVLEAMRADEEIGPHPGFTEADYARIPEHSPLCLALQAEAEPEQQLRPCTSTVEAPPETDAYEVWHGDLIDVVRFDGINWSVLTIDPATGAAHAIEFIDQKPAASAFESAEHYEAETYNLRRYE